jgi:polar amino acid transport system substrate-binding protein
MTFGPRPSLRLLAASLFASLLSFACHAQAVDRVARADLPAKIKQSGVLQVATSLQWPPFDYKSDAGQPDGIDIRLVKAIAERLGLKPEFTDVKFPSIVPGVSTGRFDIGVDQLAETPARAKVVQFVAYYGSALGLLVRQGSTVNLHTLCGHTLALTQGSSQVAVAQHLSDECESHHEKPISMLYYPDSADTYIAVANGRGDGFLTDTAVGVYIVRHNGKLTMTPGSLPETRSLAGIVINKENTELANAVRLALVETMRDGTYKKILAEYGVADAALTPSEVHKPQ